LAGRAIVSGSVTPELRNWSGTYRFTAPTVIAARTIDEVRWAVTTASRVRALGTRHSFNDLADNGNTLVTVTSIAPEPVLDEAARTVTVGVDADGELRRAGRADPGFDGLAVGLGAFGIVVRVEVGGRGLDESELLGQPLRRRAPGSDVPGRSYDA
jgi:alditol oxidase